MKFKRPKIDARSIKQPTWAFEYVVEVGATLLVLAEALQRLSWAAGRAAKRELGREPARRGFPAHWYVFHTALIRQANIGRPLGQRAVRPASVKDLLNRLVAVLLDAEQLAASRRSAELIDIGRRLEAELLAKAAVLFEVFGRRARRAPRKTRSKTSHSRTLTMLRAVEPSIFKTAAQVRSENLAIDRAEKWLDKHESGGAGSRGY